MILNLVMLYLKYVSFIITEKPPFGNRFHHLTVIIIITVKEEEVGRGGGGVGAHLG